MAFDVEGLVGRGIFENVHPDERAKMAQAFEDALENPWMARSEECRVRHSDGHWVHVEDTVMSLLDDPIVGAVVVNTRDITERKLADAERSRLEAQLQQARKLEAIGRLAGGIAHDFNNLLTAISGNVELARFAVSTTGTLIEHLDEISNAARRAADLTKQLLTFSRCQYIEPSNVNVNGVACWRRKNAPSGR